MTELRLALDRASVRQIDADGHLHVSQTPISKSVVNPYYGWEISDHEELGLDPNKLYHLYRDASELEKAADSFNGKPLLFGHKPVNANDHPSLKTVGSVTGVVWDAPYLKARLDIWPSEAIKAIQSGEHEQLSCGYAYTADMTPGTSPDGTRYDGVMREIGGNHVAMVPEGRAGPDVVVLDAALQQLPFPNLKDLFMTAKAVSPRTAASAAALSGALSGALMVYARPKMAADAKIDILPMLKGITAKNAKAKAPTIAKAMDAALKGKLAKDADLDQDEVKDIVEQVAEVMSENSEKIAAEVSPDVDVTADDDDSDLRALLKAKGYSEEEIDAICKKEAMPVAQAATDVEKVKQATDAKIRDALKGMVPKTAMDAALREQDEKTTAAIEAAVQGVKDAERQRARDLREAEAHVRPSVGALAGAFDSAPDVYRAALKVFNVANADTLPEAALRPVFDAHAGAKQAAAAPNTSILATDASATGKSIDEMFPDLKRLHG